MTHTPTHCGRAEGESACTRYESYALCVMQQQRYDKQTRVRPCVWVPVSVRVIAACIMALTLPRLLLF